MTVQSETLAYSAGGLDMTGYLFSDSQADATRPGILVFPEGPGLSDHTKAKARRLAEAGYVALACDLHGGEYVTRDMDELMGLLNPMMEDPQITRARAQGAMDALSARPEVDATKIAACGFCFGGAMALELARSGAPLAAAIGFHNSLATNAPAKPGSIAGKVLVCLGADDPGIGPDARQAFEQEMRAANVDWRMHLYGGVVHSFTNPEADQIGRPDFARYDAAADRRSLAEMLALLDDAFA